MHSFFVKRGGGGGRIQTELVSGGFFCEILVEETKRGGFNLFFSGENLLRLVCLFLMSCKNNLSIFIWGHVQNINSQLSYSCYVMIDHHVIQIFYILLLPLSSIASSGFHPIFVIDSAKMRV